MTLEKSSCRCTGSSDESVVHDNIVISEDACSFGSATKKEGKVDDPESCVDITSPPVANDDLPAVGPPPNGGFTAWMQVFAGFFLFLNSWGIVNAYGVFQTYYRSDLLATSTPSAISWIGSIQGFIIINFSVILGPLVDKGHSKIIVYIGCIVLTFGMMMTSLGHEYYQILLSQGFVMGLGCSCAFVSSVAIISSYFSTRRSTAIGLCASGSSIGGTIYPIMAHRLISRIGFPWTMRAMGFMIFATTGIASLILKPRLPPRKNVSIVHWPSLRDPVLMTFALCIFFGFAGMYIPMFYIQTYAIQQGIDKELAFYLLSVLNAGSTFGRIIPNYLADRVGPFNVILWCCACSTVLIFCWIRITSQSGLIAFCVLYGFCSGAFVSMPPVCVARITPDLSIIGSRLGLFFFIYGFGLLIGSPVAGAILNASPADNQFLGLQLFSGVTLTVSVMLCAATKFMIGRGNFFVKI